MSPHRFCSHGCLQFLCLVTITTHTIVAGAAESLTVAEDGQPRCVIVLGEQPSPAEQTAAEELQEFLKQVTGATLAIQSSAAVSIDAPQIVVGPSARMQALLPDVDLATMGADGIVLRNRGQRLVLAGPRPRGTLYAVYTFLEDIVGCRWWTSTESTIPRRPTLEIPELDIQYVPRVKSRLAYYRDALRGPFAARLKLNGSAAQLDATHGGRNRFAMFVHTFYPLLPPEKYFEKHPEWYSLIDGQRTHERAQLCLTNEAMRQELTRNALRTLREAPDARLISISQNDWYNPCQCAECQAVVDEEGSEAGPLLRMVNAVAADIEQEFPDVWVETLAYQYTRRAPKHVRPRANVVIRLCSIECSFVEPLGGTDYGGGDQNRAFREDIEAWSRIAPRLFVWDYVTNFSNYLVPHPNLRVLAPNVKFFVDHNVVGLFEQGDSQSGIGDFVALRAWLLAHLMWDPNRDAEPLIDEFLAGYYGDAAPHLRAYLDMICDAGEESGEYIRCFMPDTSAWLTVEHLNRGAELFRQAEAAVVGNAELARRVRRERLVLDHVWLSRYNTLKLAAALRNEPFQGPVNPRVATEEFLQLCRDNGVGNWRERHPFQERADALQTKFGPPATHPEEAAELDDSQWIDLQDGQFYLHGENGWATRVADPGASDGRAVRMPGNHRQWATSMSLSADLAIGNPWHVYASVRVEATAETGPAMSVGIYDYGRDQGVIHRTLSVEQTAGDTYHIIDLGVHALNGQMNVWAAPPERPGQVQSVYVDRIFLIRSE